MEKTGFFSGRNSCGFKLSRIDLVYGRVTRKFIGSNGGEQKVPPGQGEVEVRLSDGNTYLVVDVPTQEGKKLLAEMNGKNSFSGIKPL
jgi:hypothetical protein